MKLCKQTRGKIGVLVLAFAMMISMISFPLQVKAAEISGGTVLYLEPNSNWTQADARFAAYFFNNSSSTWVDMTDLDGDGVYKVVAPDGSWANVIFCRMNPSTTENNWDNKWNQTSDLTYDGTKNKYTVAADTWDKGGGTWSSFTPETPDSETPDSETPDSETPETSEIPVGTVLLLKPNSNWTQANARFAAYFFKDSSYEWTDMTALSGAGVYKVVVPDGTWTNVIFCRMNPSTTENNWDSKWNQTSNLTYDGTNDMYTITEGSWDTGTWSKHKCFDNNQDYECDVCKTHVCFDNPESVNGYCDSDGCKKIIDDIAALAGLSLTLDGKIGVNFYVELTDSLLNAENAKMVFKYADITQEVYVNTLQPEERDDKTYYIFTCKVAAKEMADVITAQVVADGIEGKKFTTSVRAYADCIVNDTTNNSDYANAAPLVDAMLRYGAYSQTYFEYNTGDMADGILKENAEYLADFASVTAKDTFSSYAPETIEITGNDKSKYKASSLILESEVKLRHYFSEEISGATQKGNDWYIESALIPANNLDDIITTTNGTDTETVTVKYSPFHYAYKALDSENTSVELKNLVKAMYLYNVEANTYIPSSAQ